MPDAPPPPQISPDGRFYWDGERWVPFQQPSPPPPPPSPVVVVKQPRGAWNSLVGYGCMAIALLFVLVAIGGWCSSSR